MFVLPRYLEPKICKIKIGPVKCERATTLMKLQTEQLHGSLEDGKTELKPKAKRQKVKSVRPDCKTVGPFFTNEHF